MKNSKGKRPSRSRFQTLVACGLLLLILFVVLETAGHEHLDFDDQDCPVCLLGIMPFLGISTFLFTVLWIRLSCVSLLPLFFRIPLFSQPTSSRAPPAITL